MSEELWTIQDLMQFFQMSRRSVDKLRAQEGFPKPIKIHSSAYPRWFKRQILEWAESLQAA